MKKRIWSGILLLCSSLLVACSSNTPADRIEQNPEVFAALPNWEKDKVIQGQIAEGMSPSAVGLAWGNPQSIASGQDKEKFVQRWIYSVLSPVEAMPMTGWGYYGRPYPYSRYYYRPVTYYPVEYIPENVAYVLFENNKVVSWERKN